jgi:hypothetical protein
MAIGSVLEYCKTLDSLGGHPAADTIKLLVNYARSNILQAKDLVYSIINKRLYDPNIPETYILPLLYVIDATIKDVGGAYKEKVTEGVNRGPGIVAVFHKCYRQMQSPHLKDRMRKLVDAWEQNRIFSPEMRSEMRNTFYANPNQNQNRTQMHNISSSAPLHFNHGNNNHNQNQVSVHSQNRFTSLGRGGGNNGIGHVNINLAGQKRGTVEPMNSIDYRHRVGEEMEKLLVSMMEEQAPKDRLSLHELHTNNPELYTELYHTAETKIKELIQPKKVQAYIGEAKCMVDVNYVKYQWKNMRDIVIKRPWLKEKNDIDNGGMDSGLGAAMLETVVRLGNLLEDVDQPPPLPPLLDVVEEYLPEQRSAMLASIRKRQEAKEVALAAAAASKSKTNGNNIKGDILSSSSDNSSNSLQRKIITKKPILPIPTITLQLERNDINIQLLYMGIICVSDGIRFKNKIDLENHQDALFRKNKVLLETDGNQSRSWHCNTQQWITDFGILDGTSSTPNIRHTTSRRVDNNNIGNDNSNNNDIDNQINRTVVLEDWINFERCPISNEKFEPKWDEKQQSQVIDNAVLVFIPQGIAARNSNIQAIYDHALIVPDVTNIKITAVKWNTAEILIDRGQLHSYEDAVGVWSIKDKKVAESLVGAKEQPPLNNVDEIYVFDQ